MAQKSKRITAGALLTSIGVHCGAPFEDLVAIHYKRAIDDQDYNLIFGYEKLLFTKVVEDVNIEVSSDNFVSDEFEGFTISPAQVNGGNPVHSQPFDALFSEDPPVEG
jgi:hypothetical protein